MLTFKEKPKKKWFAVILSRWRAGGQESTKAVCKAYDEGEAIAQIRCMGRDGWHVVNILTADSMTTLIGEEPMTAKQLSNKKSELMAIRYEREHAANIARKREQAEAERKEFEEALAMKQQEARERSRSYEEQRKPRCSEDFEGCECAPEEQFARSARREAPERSRTYEESPLQLIDLMRAETKGTAA